MNTNTTPDTALTPLLEKATGEPWQVNGVFIRAPDGLAIAYVGTDSEEQIANAALITAAVRSIRWAHSEAGVEAIARIIDPDVFDPDVLEDDYDDIDQYRAHIRTKARALVAALAKAGVGE